VRYGVVTAVAAALLGLAAGTTHAGGFFKGTFGDVNFKAKKRVVGCNCNRSLGLFLVSGAQVLKRGRIQRGASASGQGADPSAPGAVFPIVLTEPTASFFDGPPVTPTLWTGSAALGNGTQLKITGYQRGKVTGTLGSTPTPSPPATGAPIDVDATFKAKCTIQ
jgi:hypothetical protein